MKEIKFRAWDAISGRMRDVKDIISISEHGYGIRFRDQNDEFDYTGGSFVKLMQYTGLKDKNGKEIYEGDIVDDFNHLAIRKSNCFGVVEWIISRYCVAYNTHSNDVINAERTITVIGNIYENPELLA